MRMIDTFSGRAGVTHAIRGRRIVCKYIAREPALQVADVASFEMSKIGVEVALRGQTNIFFNELRKTIPAFVEGRTLALP
jgi:hypothetical protein